MSNFTFIKYEYWWAIFPKYCNVILQHPSPPPDRLFYCFWQWERICSDQFVHSYWVCRAVPCDQCSFSRCESGIKWAACRCQLRRDVIIVLLCARAFETYWNFIYVFIIYLAALGIESRGFTLSYTPCPTWSF